MPIKSKKDLEGIRKVGRVVAATIREMRRAIRPGMTTAELDAVGKSVLEAHGARSAPQLVYGFPGVCCISVNDEAVHGVPGSRVLQPGDLVKIDVTAELNGYIADAAISVVLPPGNEAAQALVDSARRAFERGLEVVRSGRKLNDWGIKVESQVAGDGFGVLKELFGHGVGRTIHEAPKNIPNYNEPRIRDRFLQDTVIAIEPIIAMEPTTVTTDRDGWTLRSANGSLTAHYEHTVLVRRGLPLVLTAA